MNLSIVNIAVITALTAALAATPVIAQTSQQPSQESDSIEKTVAGNLSEIIANLVAGLSPSTETMSTFRQKFRGGKAIVMIDGVLISTTLRAGERDLQSISVDVIQSIEVIKGAIAMYGNGETGAPNNQSGIGDADEYDILFKLDS